MATFFWRAVRYALALLVGLSLYLLASYLVRNTPAAVARRYAEENAAVVAKAGPGRTATVRLKVSHKAQRVLRRKRRLPVTVSVNGAAGDAIVGAGRRLTLRR